MRGHILTTACLAAAVFLGAAGCKSHHADRHDDHDHDVTERAITPRDVPEAVQSGFETAYPNVTVRKIKRETYKDGTIHYEYEFIGPDGKEQEVELNDEGEVLPHH